MLIRVELWGDDPLNEESPEDSMSIDNVTREGVYKLFALIKSVLFDPETTVEMHNKSLEAFGPEPGLCGHGPAFDPEKEPLK